MTGRRTAFMTLAVIIALSMAWGFGGATRASAQAEWVTDVSTDCFKAEFTFHAIDGGGDFIGVAHDAKGTLLGGVDIYLVEGSRTGSIWYDFLPVDKVILTFTLEFEGGGSLDLGTFTFLVDCFEDEAGCDVGIVPEGSVVGLFNWDAEAYWAPGQLTTNPLITIPAGKTAWVIGLDLTRGYYKIVWSCNLLWVKTGTIGPNPDATWSNTPLPGRTVK